MTRQVLCCLFKWLLGLLSGLSKDPRNLTYIYVPKSNKRTQEENVTRASWFAITCVQTLAWKILHAENWSFTLLEPYRRLYGRIWGKKGDRAACALYGSGRYQPVFLFFPSLWHRHARLYLQHANAFIQIKKNSAVVQYFRYAINKNQVASCEKAK